MIPHSNLLFISFFARNNPPIKHETAYVIVIPTVTTVSDTANLYNINESKKSITIVITYPMISIFNVVIAFCAIFPP